MGRELDSLWVQCEPAGLSFKYKSKGVGDTYPAEHFNQEYARSLTEQLFQSLEQPAHRDDQSQVAAADLTLYGRLLYGAIFVDEAARLGDQLRHRKPGTCLDLWLTPDLCWIPWELLYDNHHFFCSRFHLARQLLLPGSGAQVRERKQAKRRKSVFVALGDIDGIEHQEEYKSIDGILTRLYVTPTCLPNMTTTSVLGELEKGHALFHYIGHGVYVQDNSHETGWQCTDGILSCQRIRDAAPGAKFPFLVFANACESARPSFASEACVGDLHAAFVEQGVEHYIGTIAKVPDRESAQFAERFYAMLARGSTVSEAVWEARQDFLQQPGPPIWAYYVHYGNPCSALPETEMAGWRPTYRMVAEKVDGLMEKFRARPFVGREEMLGFLDEFLTESPSGTLVLTAPPGFGKSALLAKWVVARRAKGAPVAYHFFSRGERVLHAAADAYRNLLQQLRAYYELPDDPLPAGDESLLQEALFSLPWRRRPRGNKPLAIVIDGLDEAEDTFSPPFPLPPPEGLFIIASGRAAEREEPAYVSGLADGAKPFPLPGLLGPAIAEWVRLIPGLASLAGNTDFIRQVEQKTDGCPLHVRLVLDEMAHVHTEGRDPLDLLKDTPQGFRAYIKREWHLLGQSQEVKPGVQHLFALLAVALGPLSERDVDELTGLTRWDLEHLPWGVRRWLRLWREDSADYQCAFSHPAFQEEFAVALGYQAEKARKALLNHCANWQEHESLYALRHYAAHLKDANPSDVYELAGNEEFRNAQQARAPAEPDLPLQTVGIALQCAAEHDDATQIAEFLLRHARLADAARKESPLDALRAEYPERARALVGLRDGGFRIMWHVLLAWELTAAGRLEEGKASVKRALETGLLSLPPRAGDWVGIFLSHLLELGDDVLAEISDRALTDAGRCAFCEHLATPANVQALLPLIQRIAERIADARERTRALSAIVQMQARTGAHDAALETADAITSVDLWAVALGTISEAQARAGNFDAAFGTVARIREEEGPSARPFAGTVAVLSNRGETRTSSQRAARISLARFRAIALAGIADAQLAAGKRTEALATLADALREVSRIDTSAEEAIALASVAAVQARAGLEAEAAGTLAEAAEAASDVEMERERAIALVAIAKAQAEVGEVEAAIKTALKDWETAERGYYAISRESQIDILAAVAEGSARRGKPEEARRIFGIALEAAETARLSAWEQSRALGAVAGAQARGGFGEEARATFARALTSMEETEAEESRRGALGALAEVQAHRGDSRGALKTAEAVGTSGDCVTALVRVARSGATAGLRGDAREALDAALEVARGVGVGTMRVEALAAIARTQVEIGEPAKGRDILEEALRIATRVEEPQESYDALWAVAEAQACVGDPAAFRTACKTCDSPYGFPPKERFATIARLLREASPQSAVFRRAMGLIEEAGKEAFQSPALEAIVDALAEGSTPEVMRPLLRKARARARRMVEKHTRAGVLAAIAKVQVRIGERDAARKTFAEALAETQQEADCLLKHHVLREIGLAQAQAGDWEGAVETARHIQEDIFRDALLFNIFEAQAAAEGWQAALRGASEIRDRVLREQLAVCIAAAQARNGDFSEACRTVEQIEGETSREAALIAVARASAEAGNWRQAVQLPIRHITIIVGGSVLGDIAHILVQKGQLQDALACVEELPHESERVKVLAAIAVAQAKAGECRAAIRTAAKILTDRRQHLPAVVEALMDAGDRVCWKELLVPCAYWLDASYRVCGALGRAHPDKAGQVAMAVIESPAA